MKLKKILPQLLTLIFIILVFGCGNKRFASTLQVVWFDYHFQLASMLNWLTVYTWVSYYFPSFRTFVLFQTFYCTSRFYSIPRWVIYLVFNSIIRLIFYHLFVLSTVDLTLFVRKYTFLGSSNTICINWCTT